jgi:hypothetical protein
VCWFTWINSAVCEEVMEIWLDLVLLYAVAFQ